MAVEAPYQPAEIAKRESPATNIHAELGRGRIPFITKAHHSVTEGAAIVEGAVAELVGIDGGVVSGVINLESSGVEASDWRPRHDERYQEV